MKFFITILIMIITLTVFADNFESFAEFQTHIKRESHRVADMELHKQIKQSRDSREYEVGDQHTYWRYDLSVMPPGWIQLPATCRAVGEHCYVFVADEEWQITMDDADVQEVFNYLEFETMNGDDYGVVEMDTLHFGEMPDELDNDPRLIVFYSALGSYGGSTFDGYFSSYDQVTEAEAQLMNPPGHSNECEMIYMTCHPLNPTDPIRISVLAHELEHLIHWGGDINEETWVDEGLAELAMVYFGIPDPISQFNSNPDNSLNTWNQDWADYIKTMLFFTYFAEQFDDGTIIKDLVSEPLNSIAGISNQLVEHGYTIPFETIFENWTIANYLDDPDVEEGLYNYESLDIPIFNSTHNHASYPALGSGTTNPWATDYMKLLSNGLDYHFNLEVNHPINVGVIRLSNTVVSTVDFFSVDDVLEIDLPEMTEEYYRMVIVFPNSNNSSFSYNYEITEYFGTITGNVTLNGGNGNVQDVEIVAGFFSTTPDSLGNYSLKVRPDVYDVVATLADYSSDTVTDIEVILNETTSGVNLTLDSLLGIDDYMITSSSARFLSNYPNPFNPSTTISFETTNSHELSRIEIYNLKGQKVKQLVRSQLSAGQHSIIWDGTNENNQPVSSGIYYYKLVVDNKVIDSKKMLLMK